MAKKARQTKAQKETKDDQKKVRRSDTLPRCGIQLGDTALVFLKKDETIQITAHFEAGVNGLTVTGDPSFEQWAEGRRIRIMDKSAPFSVGDYINYGEDRFGEQASQVIDPDEGWSEGTCGVYAWVARRVTSERRRMDRLGIRHHMEVAKLTAAEQVLWLTRAANGTDGEPWTIVQFKRELSGPDGPLPPVSDYLVLVTCPNGQVQDQLLERLKAEGLQCEAKLRRRKQKGAKAA